MMAFGGRGGWSRRREDWVFLRGWILKVCLYSNEYMRNINWIYSSCWWGGQGGLGSNCDWDALYETSKQLIRIYWVEKKNRAEIYIWIFHFIFPACYIVTFHIYIYVHRYVCANIGVHNSLHYHKQKSVLGCNPLR